MYVHYLSIIVIIVGVIGPALPPNMIDLFVIGITIWALTLIATVCALLVCC